ncbi:MAG: hypothetical protein DRG63_12805 [Deltaproteobacteria bacterium]|nr:MAG: hypothetical protein DRG63_12805 [Deltaproteobacteria bacterium]
MGGKKAFVNFTEDLLIKKVPTLFPKDVLVVEVLEDVKPHQEVVEACKEISQGGYGIALDDFFYTSGWDPLISLADIIKIDFRATPVDTIREYVENLSSFGVRFLAEKVETHEEFQLASDMGFEYFQGYFFSKPQIVSGKDVSPSKINLVQLVAEANKPEFQFEELEKLILRDVSISYKLMRYINSSFFRRVHEISSIKQAIILLGEVGMRRFISLIVMAKLASDKPEELVRTSIIRARLCELLGRHSGEDINGAELFTLGLFSLIDAIMDQEMESLMNKLPLTESIKSALIAGEGTLADFLRIAVSYETGDWQGFADATRKLGVEEEKVPELYLEALGWADSINAI